MGTDSLKNSGNYQQELDDAKHTLVQLNDNIRRFIGRRSDKFRTAHEAKKSDPERSIQKISNDASKYKRRNNDGKSSVFNRLSAATPRPMRSDDEESRPRLNSRVIREMPSRQEVVAAQCSDSASRARNRRIFGTLMGTLQKFCQEESRLKDKEQKKADIEKKLEEQELQERATLKKERETLFLDRKRKQIEIKALEMKMNRVKDYELWESSTMHLNNYIRTKTKPHIYYKPRTMCKKLSKLHADSKIALQQEIEQKREALNKELNEIESNIKSDALDADDQMENMVRITVYADNNNDDSSNSNYKDKQERPHKRRVTHTTHSHNNGDLDNNTENKAKKTDEPSLSSRVVVVSSAIKTRDSS